MSDPVEVRRETDHPLVVSTTAAGEAMVVCADGEVDMSTGGLLVSGIDAALDERPAILVVDLSRVGFFGSVGVSALVEADRHCECELRVVVTPMIRRVLDIVGLQDTWKLYDDISDALPTAVD